MLVFLPEKYLPVVLSLKPLDYKNRPTNEKVGKVKEKHSKSG